MPRSAEEKARIEALRVELTTLTAHFCEAHLDAEHAALAAELIAKMARKREVPFLHGSAKLWAAGVVYALAQINFLFDRDAPFPDPMRGSGPETPSTARPDQRG